MMKPSSPTFTNAYSNLRMETHRPELGSMASSSRSRSRRGPRGRKRHVEQGRGFSTLGRSHHGKLHIDGWRGMTPHIRPRLSRGRLIERAPEDGFQILYRRRPFRRTSPNSRRIVASYSGFKVRYGSSESRRTPNPLKFVALGNHDGTFPQYSRHNLRMASVSKRVFFSPSSFSAPDVRSAIRGNPTRDIRQHDESRPSFFDLTMMSFKILFSA